MGKASKQKRAARAKRPLIIQGPREQLPEWTPLKKMDIDPALRETAAEGALQRMLEEGHDRERVLATMREMQGTVSYINSRYLVHLDRIRPAHDDDMPERARVDIGDMVHLHVKRLDYKPMGPEHFRDLQRIKDELIGPDREAVELYPSQSRLVDTGNSYHLWVVDDPRYEFPFGFSGGRMVSSPKPQDRGTPLEQQAFEDGAAPPDIDEIPSGAIVDQRYPHRPRAKRRTMG